jgi:hypothetical protein
MLDETVEFVAGWPSRKMARKGLVKRADGQAYEVNFCRYIEDSTFLGRSWIRHGGLDMVYHG